MTAGYQEFLNRKLQSNQSDGFKTTYLPDFLMDFQKHAVDWSVRKGRCLLAEDCGMGKTVQELVWSENCIRQTNKPSLILTPLAVAPQTVREAEKFGIDAKQSRDGKVHKNITVSNYEKLHLFDPNDFGSVACDEASCLKAFDGKRRKQVTRFLSKFKYRLAATATAAPNDWIELGTISEAIGEMTQSEMLGIFFLSSDKKRHSLFKEGDFWNRAKYFFKAHAEIPFWRWVVSWALAIRKPSDLGYEDGDFLLPPLTKEQHVLPSTFCWPGELFPRIAATLAEQRVERKHTLRERCEKVAELVDHDNPAICWCQHIAEGDLLETIIPGAVQVAGKHKDDEKEDRLSSFAKGGFRVLICKPKIGAFGLNYQHCGHQVFFPSHSFEQFYQCVRRSWRFGRHDPVHIDIVATEGEAGVTDNLEKKQRKAEVMFDNLVRYMRNESVLRIDDKHTKQVEAPSWL